MSHISIYQWSSLPKQWGSLQIGCRLYMGLENLKRGIVDIIQQTTDNFIIVDKLHLLLTAIRDVYAVMREN